MPRKINRDGNHEYETKIMMSKPITELSKLMGRKWFLTLEKLSEQSGVSLWAVHKAVNGEKIAPQAEEKLRAFLEGL